MSTSTIDPAELPIEVLYEAALELVNAGEDGELTLAAVVFPRHKVRLDHEARLGSQHQGVTCANGHYWNAESTYMRKNGQRVCRLCSNEQKRRAKRHRANPEAEKQRHREYRRRKAAA